VKVRGQPPRDDHHSGVVLTLAMARIPRPRPVIAAAALGALLGSLAAPAAAAEWYFYVQNSSSSKLTRLEVRQKGGAWGRFNIGSGIAPGRKVRLEWDKSTDNQDCQQTMRAFFADGTSSDPAVFDFCSDLDTPIVFSD